MTDRDMRQEWETPDEFFGVINREFDFQIDVCATNENAKCPSWIGLYRDEPTDCQDSLSENTPWITRDIRRGWCNPGFAKPYRWMEKAYAESQTYPDSVVCVLGLPSFPSAWWRRWANVASEIRLIGGRRIDFIPPSGVDNTNNPRTSCLFVFRPNLYDMPPRIWTWDWTKGLP